MPQIEYKGILARPGLYKFSWGEEEKTFEELKIAAQRQPYIMLTLGHPKGRPKASDYLGRVKQVINEEKQVIEGVFKFHDDYWEQIPEHIREKIVNNEPVSISAGYTVERVNESKQHGILYDHVALLRDVEDPLCPLDKCGINIRQEAEDMEMRYEKASDTKETPETEDTQEPTVEEPKTHTLTEEELVKYTKRAIELYESERSVPEEPAAESPEEEKSEPETEEPEPEPPREPSLEPERAFPAGKPSKGKSPYLKEDGSVEIPSSIYLGGTKKQK